MVSVRRVRRAALGAAAGALSLTLLAPAAGCRPAAPRHDTAACLDHDPASAADYTAAFADRRVWSGGDVAAPVALGDGRTLWLFGDTFVDGLGPGGTAGAMVRNSLVVQHGRCFTLVTGGSPGRRAAALPAAAPGEWLWPTGGVTDAAGGTVKVTALRMVPAPGAPGWDWRVAGVAVVTLRADDLTPLATRPAPVIQDGAVMWNGGTLSAGPHVYVYGWRRDHTVVARTTMAGMDTQPWELLGTGGWTTDREQAVAPAIGRAPAGPLWVVAHAGGFLASGKSAEMDSTDVSTWWGPAPTGPFRPVGRAAITPGAGSPWITYFGRVTPLPGAGLVAVWSRNHRHLTPTSDHRAYGPQFAPPAAAAIP
jgi:hypothetical protein